MTDLSTYDRFVVAFSGGKDSTAALLHLLDCGVDPAKVELWHHDIDGRETDALMDWPITADYCRAFASALGLPIYFSWRMGGFEAEMTRHNSRSNAVKFETPTGIQQAGGIRGNLGTRQKFPQTSPDLSVRWCSAYLKIDVASMALNNQTRFNNSKTLFITGERAQESAARSRYAQFEPHRTDRRASKKLARHVDHWRPILTWDEKEVWAIMERHQVQAHPAYYLGFGRVSCAFCIFGSARQLKTASLLLPEQWERITAYEEAFQVTMKRKTTLPRFVLSALPYEQIDHYCALVTSTTYTDSILTDNWTLPSGAFGESCGPM